MHQAFHTDSPFVCSPVWCVQHHMALGRLAGSTWPGLFVGWRDLLFVLCVVPGVYVTFLWFKQLSQR